MKSIKGTRTEKNLLASFAGESQARNRYTFAAETAKRRLFLLVGMLVVMWLVWALNGLLPFVDMRQFGIRPRSGVGLLGILVSPLLHENFRHLAANSLPFLIFGGLVMLSGRRVFVGVTVLVILSSASALVASPSEARTTWVGENTLLAAFAAMLNGSFSR